SALVRKLETSFASPITARPPIRMGRERNWMESNTTAPIAVSAKYSAGLDSCVVIGASLDDQFTLQRELELASPGSAGVSTVGDAAYLSAAKLAPMGAGRRSRHDPR